MFNKVERKKIKKLYDSFVKDRLEYGDFFEKIKVGTKMKELRGHHAGQNFVVKKIRPSGGRLNFMIEYDDGQEYSAYSDDLWDDYKANKLVFADSIARDSKKASELKEGDEITYQNEQWNVSQIRKGPFGITVRINSKSTPVKTREVIYKATDIVDSKKKDSSINNVYYEELESNDAKKYAQRFGLKLKEMKNMYGEPLFLFTGSMQNIGKLMLALEEEGLEPSDPKF